MLSVVITLLLFFHSITVAFFAGFIQELKSIEQWVAFSIYDKEKKLNFVLPNLFGTALFEEIAIFGVWYYVCVSTRATETKTNFGAHWFF